MPHSINIEPVDCRVFFLPLYSPDLNPIEKFWANIKRWIKQHIERCNDLSQAINEFFN
jgi:transposase